LIEVNSDRGLAQRAKIKMAAHTGEQNSAQMQLQDEFSGQNKLGQF
jgi:hypothetical protein